MGRTRTKTKIRNEVTDPPPPHSTSSSKPPSVEALLEKANTLLSQCDYELAARFAKRILEQNPSHVEANEILGVSLLETGEIEEARKVFESMIVSSSSNVSSSPPPPSTHLYLAQLNEDDPRLALQHYGAAVNILLGQLKGKDRAPDGQTENDDVEVKSNIVRALIGQVEIWMDPSYDLWYDEFVSNLWFRVADATVTLYPALLSFEPEAEKTCEELLTMALQTDPGNAEALQALASVRMSQQRPDEAKQCLEQSWTVWKDLDPDDAKVPPIPSRLSLVRLFIELGLYSPALLVLQGIMSSDDQEVEAWYLEGWCFYLMSEQAQENGGKLEELTWQELAKDARDCLETCEMLHRNQEHPDKPLLQHAHELISKLEALGIKPSPVEDDDGDDDEGDWESVDGSADEDGDVEMQ